MSELSNLKLTYWKCSMQERVNNMTGHVISWWLNLPIYHSFYLSEYSPEYTSVNRCKHYTVQTLNHQIKIVKSK